MNRKKSLSYLYIYTSFKEISRCFQEFIVANNEIFHAMAIELDILYIKPSHHFFNIINNVKEIMKWFTSHMSFRGILKYSFICFNETNLISCIILSKALANAFDAEGQLFHSSS